MEKSNRKDTGFWIGVAVAVGVFNVGLAVVAIFVLKSSGGTTSAELTPAPLNRTVATAPPPRGTTATPPDTTITDGKFTWSLGGVAVTPTNGTRNTVMTTADGAVDANADTGKKTYSWQVARNERGILDSTPPQVKIVPTEFAVREGGWSSRQGERAIGMRQGADQIMLTAYKLSIRDRNRAVWPENMPTGQYDYIANLPAGALEALQAEAKDKLGLTASRETRDVPVLVLKVNHADAPGLKPGVAMTGPRTTPPAQGITSMHNVKITSLTSLLESATGMPVLDETGLTGNYDLEFPMIQGTPRGQKFDRLAEVQKMLLEQLGLDVIQTNAPVEMLVVVKVK